jgi:hypothetical protein
MPVMDEIASAMWKQVDGPVIQFAYQRVEMGSELGMNDVTMAIYSAGMVVAMRVLQSLGISAWEGILKLKIIAQRFVVMQCTCLMRAAMMAT